MDIELPESLSHAQELYADESAPAPKSSPMANFHGKPILRVVFSL